jgi:glutamate synthase (NADPH/NADH) small chain
VLLTGGSEKPRDLPVPGRDLKGVHFAMDYLIQQNRRLAGELSEGVEEITALDKHVVVIGGGDTGADCVGTAARHGAKSILQIEIMPKPPEKEDKGLTWPNWPNKLRTSSSHEEGCLRDWSLTTKEFIGENGQVTGLKVARVDAQLKETSGKTFDLRADLVLLAMGFVHPVQEGMLKQLGVALDGRGNVAADEKKYQTSVAKVFAAGDMRRGQSLIVWAIREGRQAARAVDEFLMGESLLPR